MSRGVAFALAGNSLLAAGASPSSVSGNITGGGTCTSGATTATPTLGSGSYAYSWSAPGLTVTSPTSASTTFSASLSNGGSASGTATCTVTDRQNGQTVASSTVSVSLTSTSAEAVDISPSSAIHGGRAPSSGPWQDTFAVVISNGVGPYTYSWTVNSGLGATIVGSSTGSSCTFEYYMGPNNSQFWGTFLGCHVVDTGNATSYDPSAGIVQTPA